MPSLSWCYPKYSDQNVGITYYIWTTHYIIKLHMEYYYAVLARCRFCLRTIFFSFFFNRCQHHYKSKITEDFKYIFQVLCYKILSHLTFSNTSGKLLHVSVKYLKAIHSQCCFHKQQQQLLACYNFWHAWALADKIFA